MVQSRSRAAPAARASGAGPGTTTPADRRRAALAVALLFALLAVIAASVMLGRHLLDTAPPSSAAALRTGAGQVSVAPLQPYFAGAAAPQFDEVPG